MYYFKIIMPHSSKIGTVKYETKEDAEKACKIMGFEKINNDDWVEVAGKGKRSFIKIING